MTLVQCRGLPGGFDVDIHCLINSKDKYARIFKAPLHIGHGEVRLQSDCVAIGMKLDAQYGRLRSGFTSSIRMGFFIHSDSMRRSTWLCTMWPYRNMRL